MNKNGVSYFVRFVHSFHVRIAFIFEYFEPEFVNCLFSIFPTNVANRLKCCEQKAHICKNNNKTNANKHRHQYSSARFMF